MKYEGYADHLNTPYHLEMISPHFVGSSLLQKLQKTPQNILFRLRTEFEDLYNFTA
jgi:hypothetical protein